MPFDLYMVIGVIILALAIPSAMSAWIDKRAPRISALLILGGGGLIIYAVRAKPGGYRWAEVPEAFVTVVGHYFF
ncbi:hypothetical protein [Maritimibacter sp. UBA3975]|uniref:hypothetical protein n=1 Tax=Maritimibacter sp. UBA3975 TaxID=1946833 RepID=UPI0025BE9591|nr:hypothetical protein [Maritimibacter sp. UBA3975]|tara:strand:+ start:33790 stop:34014 length:225 start_codon:yes stop_codon:yes gene_type:complete